jgi:hypothetical protein
LKEEERAKEVDMDDVEDAGGKFTQVNHQTVNVSWKVTRINFLQVTAKRQAQCFL